LGVINLAVQNKALLFKHLHNFFNKADVPWVDLKLETQEGLFGGELFAGFLILLGVWLNP
jgi:hypothetical protein